MLPVLIWLDAFVVVLAPGDGFVNDLLNTESPHFVLVLEDVVEDGLADTVKIVFVDLVQHRVYQVLDSLFFHSMEVARDEFNNVRKPILPDRGNDVDLDFVFNILSVPGV